ncbi:MAG: conjugative transfer signal peptidase TraF [Rhodocyclaceae bacterium]|nr:MAG: conjugative transfer signal peptidase TraF [Rhodocyclaceae bacterium]
MKAFLAMATSPSRGWRPKLPYLTVTLIWGLAYVRLFIDPTPHSPLLFNWTPSLPYRVALLSHDVRPPHRGELIIFAFDGPVQEAYPGLRGQPFFKIVRGLPGDRITVADHQVAVNGESMGAAKPHAWDGRPLTPITPGVIPAGHYYVQGTSPDSFDSRYRESGLVAADQVIGHVMPLF